MSKMQMKLIRRLSFLVKKLKSNKRKQWIVTVVNLCLHFVLEYSWTFKSHGQGKWKARTFPKLEFFSDFKKDKGCNYSEGYR
mgnify:CR=1 FL=1